MSAKSKILAAILLTLISVSVFSDESDELEIKDICIDHVNKIGEKIDRNATLHLFAPAQRSGGSCIRKDPDCDYYWYIARRYEKKYELCRFYLEEDDVLTRIEYVPKITGEMLDIK